MTHTQIMTAVRINLTNSKCVWNFETEGYPYSF